MPIKILFLCFVLTLATVTASAETKVELQDKLNVLKVLKKYSETVACSTSFDDVESLNELLENVILVDDDYFKTYYVLWHANFGCLEGSSSYNNIFYVSKITRHGEYRPWMVINNDAFDGLITIDSKQIDVRYILKLKQLSNTKFIILADKIEINDHKLFTSKRYQYTLQSVNNKWKITNIEFIKNNSE